MLKSFLKNVMLICIGILLSCSQEQSAEKINESGSDAPMKAEALSKKKEILQKLKGEYKLKAISAFMGANTMVDYTIENGKWKGTASSNFQGMREEYDASPKKNEITNLNSMKISINEDLTINVSCGKKMYFSVPFSDDKMTYLLNKSPKDYSSGMPEQLNETSTFIDEYLYLYTKDKIAEEEYSEFDFVAVIADVAVLKYNLKTEEFELVLFYGDCCDTSTYFFSKA